MNPNYKIKVFVSSMMKNSSYTNARKHLNHLIDGSKILQRTSVDDGGAADEHPNDNALRLLEQSHICVFLINHKDGISKYVLEEHDLAKDKNIARLYYFCVKEPALSKKDRNKIIAEGGKSSNDLCKELIGTEETREFSKQFYEVDFFADAVIKAYDNILDTIAKSYVDYRLEQTARPILHSNDKELNIATIGDI